jgi:hypothetical protein
MSELATLALIGIMLTLSSVAILYADRWWHNRKEAIATGVSNGVPISGRHRWLLLYNQWMVLGVSIATYAVIMGFLFAQFGGVADHPGAKLAAYLSAGYMGIVAVVYLWGVAAWLVHLRSILRQAEAD